MEINEKIFYEKTKESFTNFYKKNKSKLIYFIYKYTKDIELSKDISQLSFIKMLNNINNFEPSKSSIKTFLFSIAINEIRQNYIKMRRFITHDFNELSDNKDEAFNNIILSEQAFDFDFVSQDKINNEIFNMILNEINNLDNNKKYIKYKDVLELYINGISYETISKELNLNINTTKSRIRKGKEIIRKKINVKLKNINSLKN